MACFPETPSLLERGKKDAVGDLYCRMEARGELALAGERVTDVAALLRMGRAAYGNPDVVVADRWREGELRQALSQAGIPPAALVIRGQGYRDGGEDVRNFRKAVVDGRVRMPVSLLMRAALAGAVTVSDAAGNSKLAKKEDTPDRRDGHRDDAVAAMILAVGTGYRRFYGADVESLQPSAGYSIIN